MDGGGHQYRLVSEPVNVKCAECGKMIRPGDLYYWKQVKKGVVIQVLRICPKCKEVTNGR